MKKMLLCLSILLLTVLLPGCMVKSEIFEDKGVKIKLTSDFEEVDVEQWDYYLENDTIAFMSNRIGKLSQIEGANGESLKLLDLSLQQFLVVALQLNGITMEQISIYKVETDKSDKDFYYCYYSVEAKENTYGYMMMVMESDNFFYTMNFSTDYDVFEENKSLLLSYAVTIEIE